MGLFIKNKQLVASKKETKNYNELTIKKCFI